MPRNGSGVYSKAAGTTAAPNTTIESAKYNAQVDDMVDDLNAARPITAGGTGATSASAARTGLEVDKKVVYAAKTGAYTAVAADNNAVHRFTDAGTVTLTAAATLATNWHYTVIADGGARTIDPNSTELINGGSTIVVADGEAAFIICDGTGFEAVIIPNASSKTNVIQAYADVASASSIDLGAAPSQNVRITGTTTITSLGTSAAGIWADVLFSGALTMTHNGTSLILQNGGSNIVTAAGDTMRFVSLGSGNWRQTDWQKATPTPVIFTKSYVSAEQTITAAGTLTLAHGLGEPPKLVAPVLICKTAEFGYSIGDIIPMPPGQSTAALNNFGASIEISGSTNIVIRYGAAATSFLGVNKTTGNTEVLTNANWRLIMRAYA